MSTCDISGGLGIVIGSRRDISCLYTPVRGRQRAYGGTGGNVGLDVGASMAGQASFGVAGAGPASGLGVTRGGTVLSGPNVLEPLGGGLRNGIGMSAGIGSIGLQPIHTAYRSGRRQRRSCRDRLPAARAHPPRPQAATDSLTAIPVARTRCKVTPASSRVPSASTA